MLGLHYAVPWPNRELESGRPQRVSPLHDTLAAAGAVFGTKMGWERPNFFAPGAACDYTWGKPSWLAASAAEQRATRTGWRSSTRRRSASTSSAGPDALAALQWICAADVDVPVGRCVYTPFLNAPGDLRGGPDRHPDGEEEFLLVSSSATTIRDLDWLRRQTPDGLDVQLRDVTDDVRRARA